MQECTSKGRVHGQPSYTAMIYLEVAVAGPVGMVVSLSQRETCCESPSDQRTPTTSACGPRLRIRQQNSSSPRSPFLDRRPTLSEIGFSVRCPGCKMAQLPALGKFPKCHGDHQ